MIPATSRAPAVPLLREAARETTGDQGLVHEDLEGRRHTARTLGANPYDVAVAEHTGDEIVVARQERRTRVGARGGLEANLALDEPELTLRAGPMDARSGV